MRLSKIVDLSFDSKGVWTLIIKERHSENPEVIKKISSIESINESQVRKLFESEIREAKNSSERKS